MSSWHLAPHGVPRGWEGTHSGFKQGAEGGCPGVGGNKGGQWVPGEVGEGWWRVSLPLTAASCVPQTLLLCWRLPGAWRTGCSSSSASNLNRPP